MNDFDGEVRKLKTTITSDVDKESFSETQRYIDQAEENIHKLLKDNKDKLSKELEQYLLSEKERTVLHYSQLKDAVDNHFTNLQGAHKRDSMEWGDLEKKRSDTVQTINKEMSSKLEGFKPENLQQIHAGFQKIVGVGKELALSFAPGLVGILSAASLIAHLKEANDQLREMQFLARRIQFASGEMPSTFGGAFEQKARGIRKETGMGMNAITSLGMMFASEGMFNYEGKGVKTAGDLTRGAIGLGARFPTAGGAQGVVETERKLFRLGTPVAELENKFLELAKDAERTHTPMTEYTKNVISLTERNRAYGVTIDDSNRLVGSFARELKAGTISLEQLSKIQTGVSQVGLGTQSYLAQQLLQTGNLSPENRTLLENAGNNPVSQGMALRRISEGQRGRESLTRSVGLLAIQQAQEMAGTQGITNPQSVSNLETYFTEKFLQMYGLVGNGTVKQFEELKDAILGNRKLEGKMPSGPETPEEAISEGMKALTDSMSLWQQLSIDLEDTFVYFIMDLRIMFERYFGNTTYRKMAESPGSPLNILYGRAAELLKGGLQPEEEKEFGELFSRPGVRQAFEAIKSDDYKAIRDKASGLAVAASRAAYALEVTQRVALGATDTSSQISAEQEEFMNKMYNRDINVNVTVVDSSGKVLKTGVMKQKELEAATKRGLVVKP